MSGEGGRRELKEEDGAGEDDGDDDDTRSANMDMNIIHGVTSMLKSVFENGVAHLSADDRKYTVFHHMIRMSDIIATSSPKISADNMTLNVVTLCKHLVHEVPLVKLTVSGITTELAKQYILTDGGLYTEDVVEYYMTKWLLVRTIMDKVYRI